MRRKVEGFHITDRVISYVKPRNYRWYWKSNAQRNKYYIQFRALIKPGYKTMQTNYLIDAYCTHYEMQADIAEAESNLSRRYEEVEE